MVMEFEMIDFHIRVYDRHQQQALHCWQLAACFGAGMLHAVVSNLIFLAMHLFSVGSDGHQHQAFYCQELAAHCGTDLLRAVVRNGTRYHYMVVLIHHFKAEFLTGFSIKPIIAGSLLPTVALACRCELMLFLGCIFALSVFGFSAMILSILNNMFPPVFAGFLTM
jgi:hypothetical protein